MRGHSAERGRTSACIYECTSIQLTHALLPALGITKAFSSSSARHIELHRMIALSSSIAAITCILSSTRTCAFHLTGRLTSHNLERLLAPPYDRLGWLPGNHGLGRERLLQSVGKVLVYLLDKVEERLHVALERTLGRV